MPCCGEVGVGLERIRKVGMEKIGHLDEGKEVGVGGWEVLKYSFWPM